MKVEDKSRFGATFAGYAEAFAVFAKYTDIPYCVQGEHDVVLVSCEPEPPMSAEDVAHVESLGWFISDEYGCWARFT